MRKVAILAIFLLTPLTGCNILGRNTCPVLQNVTLVVVGNTARTDLMITNPEKIRQIVVFANARRKSSQPGSFTMPAPKKTVSFFRDEKYLCSIGAGSNFFTVNCPPWRGVRQATQAELDEFDRLIAP